MSDRSLVRRVHLVSAVIAFAAITTFWVATASAELFGGAATVVAVKTAILWGMGVLVPAVAVAGITGARLGGRSRAPVIARKRRRMPLIAANGLLVLIPSAIFLAARATAGQFDAAFYIVQAIELIAGATNITLMGLNIRDGLDLGGRRRRVRAAQA